MAVVLRVELRLALTSTKPDTETPSDSSIRDAACGVEMSLTRAL